MNSICRKVYLELRRPGFGDTVADINFSELMEKLYVATGISPSECGVLVIETPQETTPEYEPLISRK